MNRARRSIPKTSPTRYLTEIVALNILSDRGTGDWHQVIFTEPSVTLPRLYRRKRHAFYLFANELGGHAWETAGRIWYDTMCTGLREDCTFAMFAAQTVFAAEHYGATTSAALARAWRKAGVLED